MNDKPDQNNAILNALSANNGQGFDMNALMEKAKEMQAQFQNLHSKMTGATFTGKAGGGLVSIQMRGNHYALKVNISADLVPGLSMQDREMLEDLVTAAINDAIDRIEASTKENLSSFVGDIKLPEGFGGAESR